MPTFEVEHDGKTYDVEAPDAKAAAGAFAPQTSQQPAGFNSMRAMSGADPFGNEQSDVSGNKAVMGAALRAPTGLAEGAGQAVVRAGKALGIVSPEYAKDYEDAVANQRADFAQNNEGGKAALGLSDTMQGMIPVGGTAMATERVGGRILSSLWNIGKAGALGGTVASTHVTEADKSKLGEIGVGAAFPAAFQTVAGVYPTIRNMVAGAIQRAIVPRTQQMMQQAQNFFTGSEAVPNPAPFTLAQQTGNPIINRLENRARGSAMNELNATQLDQTRDRFAELADAASRQGAAQISGGAGRTVQVLNREMRTVASNEYGRGLEEVEALGRNSYVRAPLTNLRNAYQSILAEDANPFRVAGRALPPTFGRAYELLQQMGQQGYNASVTDVAQMLRGFSAHSDDINIQRYAATLRAALDQDLSASMSSNNIPVPHGTVNVTDEPFQRLNQIRTQYALRMQRVERLEDDSITRLFGDRKAFTDPRATLDKFYSLAPEDQRYAVNILEARAPGVLQAMRGDRIRTALDAAQKLGPATESTFDMGAFKSELFDGRKGVATSALWDDATRTRMLEGGARMQILMNNMSKQGGSTVWPEEIAINVISRNPAFLSRIATRMAYGTHGDRLLGTPEGLAALRTFTNVGRPKAQSAAQAAAWVLDDINNEEAPSK